MKIALFTDKPPHRLESFIRFHIQKLGPDVIHVYRQGRAYYTADAQPVAPFIHRSIHAIAPHMLFTNRESSDRTLSRCIPQPVAKWQIRRFLKKNKIDVVLAEFGTVGTLLIDHCERAGVPLVTHFHGHGIFNRKTFNKYKKYYPRLFEVSARIIAVSNDMVERLIETGAPPKKIIHISCGVDTEIFKGAKPAEAPPHFVAVGNMIPIKAPHIALLAMSKVVESLPEAHLTYIGDGPLTDICKQLAKSLGIAGNVNFPGRISNDKVADIMRHSRAFIQHSMECETVEAEGTPVALLEASSSGLPPVASKCGGMKDVIIHGQTGYLVEQGDFKTMAQHMIELASNAKKAESIGNAARKRIVDAYSHDKLIKKLRSTLEEASK